MTYQSDRPTEQPDTDASDRGDGTPQAHIRSSKWRLLVWSIPLAALIVAGYLALRTFVLDAGTVEVRFAHASGISEGAAVKYRGVKVGKVTGLTVEGIGDEPAVALTLEMRDAVTDGLREGAKFWIVQPSLTGGNIAGLLSGGYVAMLPGEGEKRETFDGLSQPPIVQPPGGGASYVLYTDDATGVSAGTPILYRGHQVGEVAGLSLPVDGDRVFVHVFVREPYGRLVSAGSRFFRSGGVDLAIGGEGVDVDMPGVRTLLQGAIAFTSPTPGSGRPAGAEATFSLHESREAAARAFTGPPVAYAIRFPGAAGALDEGAPVRMAGIRVGRVRQVALEIDPAAGRVATPVVIELDPAKLNVAIDDGEPGEDAADPTSRLNQAMRQLIQQGLRAQLSDAGLILGGRQIELVMTDQTGVAAFDLGDTPPRIPAIRAAGLTETLASLGDVAQSVQSITADIEDIPLRRIGGDLAEAVDRINQLSARLRDVAGSQQVDQAVQRLNQTLANLRSLSQTADQRVEPIMESAQSATQAIESAADALASVTGGSVRDQHDIEALVEELIRTARSVRSLTDYLSRNPEALLQGMEE